MATKSNFKIFSMDLNKIGDFSDVNSYLKQYQLRFNKLGKLENTIPGVNNNMFSSSVLEQKFYLTKDKNLLKEILEDALYFNKGFRWEECIKNALEDFDQKFDKCIADFYSKGKQGSKEIAKEAKDTAKGGSGKSSGRDIEER